MRWGRGTADRGAVDPPSTLSVTAKVVDHPLVHAAEEPANAVHECDVAGTIGHGSRAEAFVQTLEAAGRRVVMTGVHGSVAARRVVAPGKECLAITARGSSTRPASIIMTTLMNRDSLSRDGLLPTTGNDERCRRNC